MHTSLSRAFQRHQEHDLKHLNSVDLITTKQNKLPSLIDRDIYIYTRKFNLRQTISYKSVMLLEHLEEHFGNLMGTRWELDGNTLWQQIKYGNWLKARCYWEHPWEPDGNMLGTKKKRKEFEALWVHAEASHWLHEIYISKTVCHHFWPGLVSTLYIFYNHLTISQSNLKDPLLAEF